VLGANRRLRYANPAWETLTGKSFAALRGTRISATRESASPLWKVLAPPVEVWNGSAMQIRRARPDADHGPPWWDISFVPLTQPHGSAVIGFLTQVGEAQEKHSFREPPALATVREHHAKQFTLELFAGSSPNMQRLQQQLRTTALVHASVWIRGEPGTGKETAARVIHHIGPWKEKAFVALDCRALQPYLIEQLCIGRGGFASSKAVGTLLLKSPELLPRELQAKFVEWSEAKNAPRIISCSAKPPGELVIEGSLVPGFLAKLAALAIDIPPLRERFDELPGMVQFFSLGECDEGIWPALRAHSWPGNLRELRSAMNDAAKNASGNLITVEHLPLYLCEMLLIANSPTPRFVPLAETLESVEREAIKAALESSNSQLSVAAKRLGLSREKLMKRMKTLGME